MGTASSGELLVSLPLGNKALQLTGADAERAAGYVLPAINWAGAEKSEVQRAVELIESSRKAPGEFLYDVAERTGLARKLQDLPNASRLALEMATHEESERRAMEGELALLEAAWRQAEEIANIADNLLVPPTVDEFLEKNRPRR
jgi:hypothetical protein